MSARHGPDPRGLALLLVTVMGWGFNWPAMKLLLAELPPFSMRVVCALVGIALLGGIALARRENLGIPRGLWPRLIVASLLNVTAWMGLASFSLVWLTAGEATIVCYTMPVWTAVLAWLVLGEPPTAKRLAALGLGLAGLAVLVLGKGVDVGLAKLPGVAVALGGAILFALGSILTKRWPLGLPPASAVIWQMGLGALPLLAGALLVESPDFPAMTTQGWLLVLYGGVGPLGLCYLAWFGALRRLPAAAAAAGTLLTPVVGVASAAFFLGEPLGLREMAALGLTVSGVVLAVRG